MLPRVGEIGAGLHARRGRAEAEGRLGEIEGIGLTLGSLREKRSHAERAATFVGLPAYLRAYQSACRACPERRLSIGSAG
jgi:hypothetical protein